MYYLLSFVNVTFWRSSLTKSIFVAVDESLCLHTEDFQSMIFTSNILWFGVLLDFVALSRFSSLFFGHFTRELGGLQSASYPSQQPQENMYSLKIVGENRSEKNCKYSEGCSSFSD